MTDARVEFELEINEANEEFHSEDLAPSTRDWITIDVIFVNGYKKSYHNLTDLLNGTYVKKG